MVMKERKTDFILKGAFEVLTYLFTVKNTEEQNNAQNYNIIAKPWL